MAETRQNVNKNKQNLTLLPFPSFGVERGTSVECTIHGWCFQATVTENIKAWGERLLRHLLDLPKRDPNLKKALKRAHWFLVHNHKKASLYWMSEKESKLLSHTQSNGHFQATLKLDKKLFSKTLRKNGTSGWAKLSLSLDQKQLHPIWIQRLRDSGLSIISDIDDTIKQSNVENKSELMANTFLRPWLPVDQMSDAYQWAARNRDASFFYVSASPWQLYPLLEQFRLKHRFPPGVFKLKPFRWKDRSVLNLFQSPVKLKASSIESIIQHFKKRKFILVGDSGERDLEIYLGIKKRFSDQIALIAIRQLSESHVLPKEVFGFKNGEDFKKILDREL